MLSNKCNSFQMDIWVVVATAGPLLYYLKGEWLALLPIAILLGLLCLFAVRFGRHSEGPVYVIVQIIWISVLLSQLLPFSANCWPTGERTFPIVPLTLLFMAGLSVYKGIKSATSVISILFWIAFILIGTVVVAGIPNINTDYLQEPSRDISAMTIVSLLIPSVAGFFGVQKRGGCVNIIVPVITIAIAVWICGSMGNRIVHQVSWPFYETAKSVQLFDVAKRFESLVSVGVTLCNYALYSLLLCAVANIGEKFNRRRETIIGTTGLSGSIMLLGWSIDPSILVVICLVLWVVLPLLGSVCKKD